jgi:hypothetical protein
MRRRGATGGPVTPRLRWSGRPESNRRRPAWEAGILPLNYARVSPRSLVSRPGGCQWSASPQNLGSRGGAERRGSATRRGRRPGAPRPRSLVQGLPRSTEPTPKGPEATGSSRGDRARHPSPGHLKAAVGADQGRLSAVDAILLGARLVLAAVLSGAGIAKLADRDGRARRSRASASRPAGPARAR